MMMPDNDNLFRVYVLIPIVATSIDINNQSTNNENGIAMADSRKLPVQSERTDNGLPSPSTFPGTDTALLS
jgi:hypothetical protein